MEMWKQISVRGYNLLVSDTGKVHLPRKETTFTYMRLGRLETKTAVFKERLLKQSVTKGGYQEVSFMHNRKTFKHLVHRLVAMAYVPGFEDGLVVNHKDGNKLNNDPSNLEWTTKSANTKHAWQTNLIPLRGEDNPGAKLTEKRVAYIRKLLGQGVSSHSLAIVADVSSSLIEKIRDGERWAHVETAED